MIQRLDRGDILRLEFFKPTRRSGSLAEEVLEGVLLIVKNEHSSKKAPYLGNVLANAAFLEVTPETVNVVMGMAERMTYRQMCLIALFGREQELGFNRRLMWSLGTPDLPAKGREFLLREVYELGPSTYGVFRHAEAHANDDMSYVGNACFELMSLEDVPAEDLKAVMQDFVASDERPK